MNINFTTILGAVLVMGFGTCAFAADDKKKDTVVIKPPPAAVKVEPSQKPKRDPTGDKVSDYKPKPPSLKIKEPPSPGK